MRRSAWVGALLTLAVAACGQPTPSQPANATAPANEAPPGVTATEAVGYTSNATGAVANLSQVFASVQQASGLQLSANSTPSGATGADVQSISIVGQDKGGLLKGLDAAGKQTLGNALLTAAVAAWPNATISLLITDASGGGGTIIGQHPQGGQNTVIAT
jgi:hypothetical protein